MKLVLMTVVRQRVSPSYLHGESLTKVAEDSLGDGHDHGYADQPVVQFELMVDQVPSRPSCDDNKSQRGEEEVDEERKGLKPSRARAQARAMAGRCPKGRGVHDARCCGCYLIPDVRSC